MSEKNRASAAKRLFGVALVVGLVWGAPPRAHAHDLEETVVLRGDANGDEQVDQTDAIGILGFLFLAGPPPVCPEVADVNVDGALDMTDAVALLGVLFQGAGELAPLTHAQRDSCLGLEPELTFASLHAKILGRTCASSSCHSAEGKKGGLVLDDIDAAYESLIGVPSANAAARDQGLLRVDPGRPENSFLIRKLTGPALGEGNRMPLALAPLSEAEVSAFVSWIAAGAPRDRAIPGVPDVPDTPVPPPSRLEPPPVPENGVQLRLEPFQIAAGREREIFQIIDPGFTEEVVVNRIDVHMKEKSHHFILYTWNDRGRVPGPGHRELLSSTGVGTGARGFVVGAQSSFESFQFPEGTGIPFAAGTVFDFNSHYLNLDGEETLLGEVYVNLFFAPAGEPVRRIVSDIYGPTALHIPPGQTVSSGGTWPAGGVPAERHIHSLSSHMHRHGDFFEATLVRQDGASEEIYESANWDDPVFKVFDPPLVLQRGDRLRFSCTHTNHDRDVPIRWGFTSEDEMCFLLFQYSTPSR